jgi:Flp pilus assembly pilin Flp
VGDVDRPLRPPSARICHATKCQISDEVMQYVVAIWSPGCASMLEIWLTLASGRQAVAALEYGLIAGVVAATIMFGFTLLASDLSQRFRSVGNSATAGLANTAAAPTNAANGRVHGASPIPNRCRP